jgi:hypothetical protein
VGVSAAPPVGPGLVAVIWISSQATAFGSTKAGSLDDALAFPKIVLASAEFCQVTRVMLPSLGLGLKKCVISWFPRHQTMWLAE